MQIKIRKCKRNKKTEEEEEEFTREENTILNQTTSAKVTFKLRYICKKNAHCENALQLSP